MRLSGALGWMWITVWVPLQGEAQKAKPSITKSQRMAVLEGDPDPTATSPVPVAAAFPADRYSDAMCGGVLVNPTVYLTAAHCVEIDPEIKVNGIDAHCELDGEYKAPSQPHDVAACLLQQGLNGILYETIDASPNAVAIGDTIMLTGYGGNAGTAIGVDLAGTTTVKAIGGGLVITDGHTWIRKGGGDSGSEPYTWNNPSKRRVVGVNSAEGIGPHESVICSLAPSSDFLSKWSRDNNVKICGLDQYMGAECHP